MGFGKEELEHEFVINGHDRITEFRFMSRKIKVLQGQEIKEYNWQQENM